MKYYRNSTTGYSNESNIKKFCSRCGKLISANVWYCDECTRKKEIEDEKLKKEFNKRYNNERYKDKNNLKIKRFYGSVEWSLIRREVLIRDNYLCRDCLEKGLYKKAETVHHIEEVVDNWDRRLDKENLISLCNKCHNKRHNRW